ncbi:DNA polymerase III subunit alpha [Alkalicaulis satelles]|uniref:DNA polymerase III subunit alpha n=1 Tax=Alkalicaulis satelles TaxID=2609175 RepID=A0A5M6ZMN7_9PROT|nr:DNA polymerase III subunit alpha [Alkalicaulis satelles]KAA5804914.1 DNA polymerase III subunit alpha [Alkalicaulis satelles]
MSQRPFVHLRVRSPYSLLEGALRIGEIAELCRTHDMPAAALTDTNNLFGALEYSEYLAGAGVQPIIGCTLSVELENARAGERGGPDGTLVLLAQNQAGYANLMALSSAAWLDIDPAEPAHVSLEAVLARADGLICLTGGHDGLINRLVCAGRTGPADALLDQLGAAFGDRLYLELQRHGRPDDLTAEDYLIDRAYARGLPLVATNEPFFARPDQHGAHDALLCIAQGSYVSQSDRRTVTPEHYFKSGEEMAARFADLPEALDATLEIARRCAVRVHTAAPILPRFPTEGGRDEAEELRARAREGLDARLARIELAAPRETYESRLDFELSVIETMGFPGYFLIVSDFIQWSKAQNIPVGPGRGSGAGSVVAWALTITDLDPLRFGLLFERFLNPERVSMPDFDIDFCQDRRGEVIRYVQQRYGADRVAQIITFGTLQARAVVRDVGRVLQLPFGLVDRIAKLVPANPAAPVTLAQALESESRLQDLRDSDPMVARLIEVALQLEGLNRNASTHAAGVVIGDRPLTELVPLYQDPRADLPATQFNMKWVEPAGLVKFDFLGLKTLTVIQRALDYIQSSGAERPDLDALTFDDPASYELLASGASIGVFQLESTGMRDTLRKVKPDTIEDVIALISLYRPGPMKNIDTYVERKSGRAEPDYLHPDLEPVLKETYGVIIYQEQVMQIAQILSGYSLGEADLLRRAMGKKKKEEMDQQRVRFLDGAEQRGVPRARANFIFDLVNEFAGYGFNKSHAAAYAAIAYQTAWLKANHPVAFMAALMSLDRANTDKLAVFFQEARRMGITVLPPDVNASQADFSVEDGAVRYGLGAVRNVGFSAMEHVARVRGEGGPFRDLFDFAGRVDPRQVNKRAFENLARAGAFDALEPDRARALAAAETLLAFSQHALSERESAQVSLFGGGGGGPGLQRPRLPEGEFWDPVRRLDEELSAVGFYLSGHPLDDLRDGLARRGVVLFADLPARAAEGARAARMAAIVRARQEKVSRRSGEKFAFLTLSDPSGEFEALVPPKILFAVRDRLEPGSAVMAVMKIEEQEEGLRLIMESAETINTAALEAEGRSLRIHLDGPGPLEGVAARLAHAAARPGPRGQVHLVMALADGRRAELRLPGEHALDPAARAALKGLDGVAGVELA